MTEIARCTKCSKRLGEDHGFSTLCDQCEVLPPIEQIGAAELKRENDLADISTYTMPEQAKRVRRIRAIVPAVEQQHLPQPEALSLGIDIDTAPVVVLEAYRRNIDEEFVRVKAALLTTHQGQIFKDLETKRMRLATELQLVIRTLGSRRREAKKPYEGRTVEEEATRNAPFLQAYFDCAKLALDIDMHKLVCKMANRKLDVDKE